MALFSEAAAAVLGSIIGGVANYVAQRQMFAQQEKVRKATARSAERKSHDHQKALDSVLAFSMCLKMNRILTDIIDISNELHDARLRYIQRPRLSEEAGSFVTHIKFYSTPLPKHSFSIEELTFVRSLRRDDLLNIITDMGAVHASYVDNLAVIREMRIKWSELAVDYELLPDEGVQTLFSGVDAKRARIALFQADSLANALWLRTWHDIPRTTNFFADLQDAFLDRLGSDFVQVKFRVGRLAPAPPPDRARRGFKGDQTRPRS